jgi:hypothetical protein
VSSLLALVVCLGTTALAQPATKDFLPAGTLLHCTLDEPNFSSKTAQSGDPVLCYLSSVTNFGHSVFPRGAYLTGRMEDAKAPGHFVGKGWIEIDFDRIVLPGPEVLPLSAKVISAPHYKVDPEGKIHGSGHPTRDAVEWAIPVLWPVKILTLPARGPFPTVKGEFRVTLRLMEDVDVPGPTRASSTIPMPPDASPSSYHGPQDWRYSGSLNQPTSPSATASMQPAAYWQPSSPAPILSTQPSGPEPALLVLKDGSAVLANNYWMEGATLHATSPNGADKVIPLDALDLSETVRFNQERKVNFELKTKDISQQH